MNFNLKAANGQVIGTNEMYESAAGRDGGIASVKTHAPSATIDDKTVYDIFIHSRPLRPAMYSTYRLL
ncbi:YegP family protein [Chitinophaga sp. Ak27]|uniref:YegP family protein n=1 Tax=Chitinophaga sp. Ak27 TaxID=2726116 RepID=UPI00145E2203|nr:YegP family protein [Chitinophaga sp. Ak27]NLU92324.1 YegP family protein [Chitinophaga sp. Ak27]